MPISILPQDQDGQELFNAISSFFRTFGIGTTFANSGLLGVSQTLMIAQVRAARFCKTLDIGFLLFRKNFVAVNRTYFNALCRFIN